MNQNNVFIVAAAPFSTNLIIISFIISFLHFANFITIFCIALSLFIFFPLTVTLVIFTTSVSNKINVWKILTVLFNNYICFVCKWNIIQFTTVISVIKQFALKLYFAIDLISPIQVNFNTKKFQVILDIYWKQ